MPLRVEAQACLCRQLLWRQRHQRCMLSLIKPVFPHEGLPHVSSEAAQHSHCFPSTAASLLPAFSYNKES